MAAYTFSVQLNIQGVSGLGNVTAQLQKAVSAVKIPIGTAIDPAAARSLGSLNTKVQNLTTSAGQAQAAIQGLGTAAGSAQTAVLGLSTAADAARTSVRGLRTAADSAYKSLDALGTSSVKVQTALQGMGQTAAALQAIATAAFQAESAMRGLSLVATSAKNSARAITAAATATTAVRSATQGANAALAQSTTFFESMGAAAGLAAKRFLAFTLGVSGFVTLVSSIKRGISEALKFEKTMIGIAQVSNETESSLKVISDEVSRLSTTFGVSSTELIRAGLILKQVGISTKEVAANLETLALANLAPNFDNMTQVTEGLISVMRQFKTDADGTREAIGAMNAVAAAFPVEARDLVEVVRKAGGAFQQTGGDVNELIALFTSVRSTTRETASEISTGLRTIFTRLQRGTTVEALRELRIELRHTAAESQALRGDNSLTNQFVGAYEAVRRLSEGLATLRTTDPRYSAIIEELGGYRQVSRIIPLIQQFGEAQKAYNVAQSGGISLTTAAEKAQEGLLNKTAKVTEQFLLLFRTLTQSSGFQAFAGTVLSLASAFGTVLSYLSPLLPLLTTLATLSLARGLTGYAFNFGKSATASLGDRIHPVPVGRAMGGEIRRFATGGVVPGNRHAGDVVPALLSPGEVVIPEPVARQTGYGRLSRFAAGGQPVELLRKQYTGSFSTKSQGRPVIQEAPTGLSEEEILHIARLAGARGGDHAEIIKSRSGYLVELAGSQGEYSANRVIDPDRRIITNWNIEVDKKQRSQGIGGGVYSTQLNEAIKGGYKSIKLTASRNIGDIPADGYYVWPTKFGADGKTPDSVLEKLIDTGRRRAGTVRKLIDSPGGDAFWKEHGEDFEATISPYDKRVLTLGLARLQKQQRLATGGQLHSNTYVDDDVDTIAGNVQLGPIEPQPLKYFSGKAPLPKTKEHEQEKPKPDPYGLTRSWAGHGTVANWRENPRVLSVVRGYQQDSYFLNRHLRERGPGVQRKMGDIRTLDGLSTKFKTKKDVTVYRGIHEDVFSKLFDGASPDDPKLVGKHITDRAFLSTSLDRGVALRFGNVIYNIQVPKGKNVIPPNKILANDLDKPYKNEDELIFRRKSTLQILGGATRSSNNVFDIPMQMLASGGLVRYKPSRQATLGELTQSIRDKLDTGYTGSGYGDDHILSLAQLSLTPQVLQRIPKGSRFIGSGLVGLAFLTPQNEVIRVQSRQAADFGNALRLAAGKDPLDAKTLSPRRLNAEGILQPIASGVIGKGTKAVHVEKLPFAESVDHLHPDEQATVLRSLMSKLASQGYRFRDTHAGNIGLVGGKPTVIDPGGVVSEPGLASGELPSSYVSHFDNLSQVLRKRAGVKKRSVFDEALANAPTPLERPQQPSPEEIRAANAMTARRFASGGPLELLRNAAKVSRANHLATTDVLQQLGLPPINTQALSGLLLTGDLAGEDLKHLNGGPFYHRGHNITAVQQNSPTIISEIAHELLGHGSDALLGRLLKPGNAYGSHLPGTLTGKAGQAAIDTGFVPPYIAKWYRDNGHANNLPAEGYAYGIQAAVERKLGKDAQYLPGIGFDVGQHAPLIDQFAGPGLNLVANLARSKRAFKMDELEVAEELGPLLRANQRVEPDKIADPMFRGALAKAAKKLGLATFASGGSVRPADLGSMLGKVKLKAPAPIGILRDSLLADEKTLGTVAQVIPSGSQYLASGTEAIVLKTPDGQVVRIGMFYQREDRSFEGRPNIPEMLQANSSTKVGNFLVEKLPFVPTLRDKGLSPFDEELTPQIEALRESVKSRGYRLTDGSKDNLGILPNGQLTIIDPGAVEKIKKKKFASGGLVPGTGDTDSVPMMLPVGSYVIKKSSVQRAGHEALSRLASGGGVPALLTPGEWVYGPNDAARIGRGNLHRLNASGSTSHMRFAQGGIVGRFAKGEDVKLQPGQSITEYGSLPAEFKEAADKLVAAINPLAKAFAGLQVIVESAGGPIQKVAGVLGVSPPTKAQVTEDPLRNLTPEQIKAADDFQRVTGTGKRATSEKGRVVGKLTQQWGSTGLPIEDIVEESLYKVLPKFDPAATNKEGKPITLASKVYSHARGKLSNKVRKSTEANKAGADADEAEIRAASNPGNKQLQAAAKAAREAANKVAKNKITYSLGDKADDVASKSSGEPVDLVEEEKRLKQERRKQLSLFLLEQHLKPAEQAEYIRRTGPQAPDGTPLIPTGPPYNKATIVLANYKKLRADQEAELARLQDEKEATAPGSTPSSPKPPGPRRPVAAPATAQPKDAPRVSIISASGHKVSQVVGPGQTEQEVRANLVKLHGESTAEEAKASAATRATEEAASAARVEAYKRADVVATQKPISVAGLSVPGGSASLTSDYDRRRPRPPKPGVSLPETYGQPIASGRYGEEPTVGVARAQLEKILVSPESLLNKKEPAVRPPTDAETKLYGGQPSAESPSSVVLEYPRPQKRTKEKLALPTKAIPPAQAPLVIEPVTGHFVADLQGQIRASDKKVPELIPGIAALEPPGATSLPTGVVPPGTRSLSSDEARIARAKAALGKKASPSASSAIVLPSEAEVTKYSKTTVESRQGGTADSAAYAGTRPSESTALGQPPRVEQFDKIPVGTKRKPAAPADGAAEVILAEKPVIAPPSRIGREAAVAASPFPSFELPPTVHKRITHRAVPLSGDTSSQGIVELPPSQSISKLPSSHHVTKLVSTAIEPVITGVTKPPLSEREATLARLQAVGATAYGAAATDIPVEALAHVATQLEKIPAPATRILAADGRQMQLLPGEISEHPEVAPLPKGRRGLGASTKTGSFASRRAIEQEASGEKISTTLHERMHDIARTVKEATGVDTAFSKGFSGVHQPLAQAIIDSGSSPVSGKTLRHDPREAFAEGGAMYLQGGETRAKLPKEAIKYFDDLFKFIEKNEEAIKKVIAKRSKAKEAAAALEASPPLVAGTPPEPDGAKSASVAGGVKRDAFARPPEGTVRLSISERADLLPPEQRAVYDELRKQRKHAEANKMLQGVPDFAPPKKPPTPPPPVSGGTPTPGDSFDENFNQRDIAQGRAGKPKILSYTAAPKGYVPITPGALAQLLPTEQRTLYDEALGKGDKRAAKAILDNYSQQPGAPKYLPENFGSDNLKSLLNKGGRVIIGDDGTVTPTYAKKGGPPKGHKAIGYEQLVELLSPDQRARYDEALAKGDVKEAIGVVKAYSKQPGAPKYVPNFHTTEDTKKLIAAGGGYDISSEGIATPRAAGSTPKPPVTARAAPGPVAGGTPDDPTGRLPSLINKKSKTVATDPSGVDLGPLGVSALLARGSGVAYAGLSSGLIPDRVASDTAAAKIIDETNKKWRPSSAVKPFVPLPTQTEEIIPDVAGVNKKQRKKITVEKLPTEQIPELLELEKSDKVSPKPVKLSREVVLNIEKTPSGSPPRPPNSGLIPIDTIRDPNDDAGHALPGSRRIRQDVSVASNRVALKLGPLTTFGATAIEPRSADDVASLIEERARTRVGPISSKDTLDKTIEAEKRRLQNELLSAQKRLLAVLHPEVSAAERAKLAQEQVAAALEGKAKILRDSSGRILGTEAEVQAARRQKLETPGAGGVDYNIEKFVSDKLSGLGRTLGTSTRVGERIDNFFKGSLGSGLSTTALLTLPYLSSGLTNLGGTAEQAYGAGTSGYYTTAQAAGGALQGSVLGATVGGALGSVIGVLKGFGGPAGAAIGALTGLISAWRQAEADIRNVKIANAVTSLTDKFASIAAAGLTATSDVISGADADLRLYRRESSERAQTESRTWFGLGPVNPVSYLNTSSRYLRQELGGSVTSLTQSLSRQAEDYVRRFPTTRPETVYDTIMGGNGGLNREGVNLTAQVRNVSVRTVEEEFRRSIRQVLRTQTIELSAQEGRTGEERNVNAFGRLLLSLQAASDSLNRLRERASLLAEVFEGNVGASRINFNVDNLQQLGRGDRGALEPLRALASVGGDDARRLLEVGGIADGLSRELPSILSAVSSQNPATGEDFVTATQRQLRSRFGLTEPERREGEPAPERREYSSQQLQALAAINTVVSGLNNAQRERQLAGITEPLRVDSTAFADRLLAPFLDPLKNVGAKAAKQLEDNLNRFLEGLARYRSQLVAIGESLDREAQLRVDAARQRAEIEADNTGRRRDVLSLIPLAQAQSGFQARQERLVFGANVGPVNPNDANDPALIGRRLAATNTQIVAAEERQRQAALTQRGFPEAAQALLLLRDRAANLQQALRNLADVAQRNAAIQERLGAINQDRESRLAFGERYITSSFEQRAETQRGLVLANLANNQGNFNNMLPQDAQLALSTLRGLGNARLTGFRGSPIAADRADELVRATQGGVFELDPQRRGERGDLQAALLRNMDRAVQAQQALTENSRALSTQFFSQLQATQAEFLGNLNRLLAQDRLLAAQARQGTLSVEQGELQGRLRQRELLQSVGIRDEAGVRALLERRSDVQSLGTSLGAISAEERNYNTAFDNLNTLLAANPELLSRAGVRRSIFADVTNTDTIRTTLANSGLTGTQINSIIANQRIDFSRREANVGTRDYGNPRAYERFNRQALFQALANELRGGVPGSVSERAQNNARDVRTRLGTINGLNLPQLEEQLRTNPDNVLRALDAFQQAGSFDRLPTSLRNVNNELTNLGETIRQLNLSVARNSTPLPEPLRRAHGGPIFAPQGTDTVPAMLTPGEMVINRASTQANMGLLRQINEARGPLVGHFAYGGMVPVQYLARGGPLRRPAQPGVVGPNLLDEARRERLAREETDRALGPLPTAEEIRELARQMQRTDGGDGPLRPLTDFMRQANEVLLRRRRGELELAEPAAQELVPFQAPPPPRPRLRAPADFGFVGPVPEELREAIELQRGRAREERAEAARLRERDRFLRGFNQPAIAQPAAVLPGPAIAGPQRPRPQANPLLDFLFGATPDEQLINQELARFARSDPNGASGILLQRRLLEARGIPVGPRESVIERRSQLAFQRNLAFRQGLSQSQNPFAAFGVRRADAGQGNLFNQSYNQLQQSRVQASGRDLLQRYHQLRRRAPTAGVPVPRLFAEGGIVEGSGNTDSVLSLLTPGEAVLNPGAVRALGTGAVHRFNRGGLVPGGPQYLAEGGVAVASGSGIRPEVLQAMQRFSEAAVVFGQHISGFSTSVIALQTAFAGFNSAASRLAEALSSFPSKLVISGSQRHEIVLNGAEVLSRIMPDLQKLLTEALNAKLAKVFRDHLPEVPLNLE